MKKKKHVKAEAKKRVVEREHLDDVRITISYAPHLFEELEDEVRMLKRQRINFNQWVVMLLDQRFEKLGSFVVRLYKTVDDRDGIEKSMDLPGHLHACLKAEAKRCGPRLSISQYVNLILENRAEQRAKLFWNFKIAYVAKGQRILHESS